jgi:DNA-binding PadR family transcriptional regulator
MDILPIRKLYILLCLISLSSLMVKPKGTTGATKMKILAIIDHNCKNGRDSYGYTIWQSLKNSFHIYLNHNDVRNVYHHLKELCELELLVRNDNIGDDPSNRCLYRITNKGQALQHRYIPYLDIVKKSLTPSKY